MLPKNNNIWTHKEKDGMTALIFRRMPKKHACFIDMYGFIHILKGLSVWNLT